MSRPREFGVGPQYSNTTEGGLGTDLCGCWVACAVQDDGGSHVARHSAITRLARYSIYTLYARRRTVAQAL
eukprot:6431564-Alexandrium_andersonii.AAC.1